MENIERAVIGMRLPYRKMYHVLERNQGKQLALCQKALQAGTELYCTILASERENILPEESRERQRASELLSILEKLHDCMIDTDKAVEKTIIG